MMPTIKQSLANTYHRDGTVSLWNVLTQTWERRHAAQIGDDVLATLNESERARIARAAVRVVA